MSRGGTNNRLRFFSHSGRPTFFRLSRHAPHITSSFCYSHRPLNNRPYNSKARGHTGPLGPWGAPTAEMEVTAAECEARRRERTGTPVERIFKAPILQGPLASFLEARDLLSFCSSCKFLEQQQKPGGFLHSAIERELRHLLGEGDALVAESLLPHGYCSRWRLSSCSYTVKPPGMHTLYFCCTSPLLLLSPLLPVL